jgi:hypothetical protein
MTGCGSVETASGDTAFVADMVASPVLVLRFHKEDSATEIQQPSRPHLHLLNAVPAAQDVAPLVPD